MPKKKITKKPSKVVKKQSVSNYQQALSDIKQLVQQARYASARSVNAIMTATYWEIGRRIVKVEQKGQKRADYGEELIKKMSKDLTKSVGKGFGFRNLKNFRKFYLTYSHIQKGQTVSAQFKPSQKGQTLSEKFHNLLKTHGFSEIQEKLPELFPLLSIKIQSCIIK